jgi:hypothetical protein
VIFNPVERSEAGLWSKEYWQKKSVIKFLKETHEKIKRDREEKIREENDEWNRRVTHILGKLPTIMSNAHLDGFNTFLIHGLPQDDFEDVCSDKVGENKYITHATTKNKSLSGTLRKELNNLGLEVKVNTNNGFDEYCLEVKF